MKLNKDKLKKKSTQSNSSSKQSAVTIDTLVERPAYKTKKFKEEAGIDRYYSIIQCKDCNGSPVEVKFNLSTMEGTRCEECLKVIKYNLK